MVKRTAETMLAVISRLRSSLESAKDNKGVQYKINTQAGWKGTVGLRCNHVFFESITHYIAQVSEELEHHQAFPLLEHVSVNHTYHIDPTTNKKRSVPWKRTIYVTFRPGRELHATLMESLPDAVDNYLPLNSLLDALGELK